MSERLTINYEKKPCYDIVFSASFEDLTDELTMLEIERRRICVLTDTHVSGLYGGKS